MQLIGCNPFFCAVFFCVYGEVAGQRQGEIIRDLATPQTDAPTGVDDIAEAVFRKLQKAGVEA
ncbi:MAG: hypothetical protein D3904_02330 [Candidatus Electrothrix sp. EH2]|nr:hypothetical protein [Candidatus Electrothrix sp. EH2]